MVGVTLQIILTLPTRKSFGFEQFSRICLALGAGIALQQLLQLLSIHHYIGPKLQMIRKMVGSSTFSLKYLLWRYSLHRSCDKLTEFKMASFHTKSFNISEADNKDIWHFWNKSQEIWLQFVITILFYFNKPKYLPSFVNQTKWPSKKDNVCQTLKSLLSHLPFYPLLQVVRDLVPFLVIVLIFWSMYAIIFSVLILRPSDSSDASGAIFRLLRILRSGFFQMFGEFNLEELLQYYG